MLGTGAGAAVKRQCTMGFMKRLTYHHPRDTWRFGVVLVVAAVLAAGAWWVRREGLALPLMTPGPTASLVPTSPTPVPSPVAVAAKPWVQDLVVPWSLLFTSDSRALVTERAGRLRVIENGKLLPAPLFTLGDISNVSEEGLMGLAKDPAYGSNKLLYACYAYKSAGAYRDKVVRFEDRGTSVGPMTTVIDGIPAAANHAGCRLGFGPEDGKLYITTGDASQRAQAQDKASLGGKILRVNPDGSIPADNPYTGSPIWTLGHRNPQGLAWQPGTGRLYASEHGPSGWDGDPGGDEINLIARGANYGWPVVSHTRTDSKYVSPLKVYTPAIAPSGISFYNGSLIPQLKGHLLVTGLAGTGLYDLDLSADGQSVISSTKLSELNVGRLRDVIQGPDGALYVLTSNRDGRGTVRTGDDTIYRLAPLTGQ